MSFLKKLFGTSENETNPSNQPTKLTSTPKRTIFDFFQIDIKNIPDDSFIAGEIEENTTGDKVQNFRKSLDYKECGIFDTIEVKLIGDEGKNKTSNGRHLRGFSVQDYSGCFRYRR